MKNNRFPKGITLYWTLALISSVGLLNLRGNANEPLIISIDGSPQDSNLVWKHGFPLVSWEREIADANGKVTSQIFGGNVTSTRPFNFTLNIAFCLLIVVFSAVAVAALSKTLPLNRFSLRTVFAVTASVATVLALNTLERFSFNGQATFFL